MGMSLELAAAAAATVVMALCGRTVVAGVAALPCGDSGYGGGGSRTRS
jgi:hypothetical protein